MVCFSLFPSSYRRRPLPYSSRGLICALGCHSNSLRVHLPLLIRVICPSHLHFRSAITSMTSLTFLLDLIQVFLFQQSNVILSTALSIAVCAIRSLCADISLRITVSAPHVNNGRTYCSKTCRFRLMDILLRSA